MTVDMGPKPQHLQLVTRYYFWIDIKPNSSRVLTHRPFNGPYLVVDKMQRDPSICPSFKLVHKHSGKPLRHLVNPDRLKLLNENRETFETMNPPLTFDENKRVRK